MDYTGLDDYYTCKNNKKLTVNKIAKRMFLAESVLLAMAHNINKLHNKIQPDRTGTHNFKNSTDQKSLNIKGLLKCIIF